MNQLGSLGLWRLTLLVAGNLIGSGIFLLPSSLAQYASLGILAWGATAIGAIALALLFSELSAVLPEEGGFYTYCRKAFGNFVGFQVAYSYWIALWVGNAALVVALTGYLSYFFPLLNQSSWLAWLVNIAIIWSITLLNIVSLRSAITLQAMTTLVKAIPLIAMIGFGLYRIQLQNFHVFNLSGMSASWAFHEAATLTFWSFLGLESASLSSNYCINPARDIPRATLLGVIIAAVFYIGSYITIVGLIPFEKLMYSAAPYAEVGNILFGPYASQGIAGFTILVCLGSLAGWILLQGQIPYVAAQDRLFPTIFLKLNNQKVPVAGLVISSALMSFLLLLNVNQSLVSQFTFIILLATLASLIPYFFTSFAALVLLLQHPDLFTKRRRRIVILSVLSALYTFWAIVGSGQAIVFYGCLLLLSSMPLYVSVQWNFNQSSRFQ